MILKNTKTYNSFWHSWLLLCHGWWVLVGKPRTGRHFHTCWQDTLCTCPHHLSWSRWGTVLTREHRQDIAYTVIHKHTAYSACVYWPSCAFEMVAFEWLVLWGLVKHWGHSLHTLADTCMPFIPTPTRTTVYSISVHYWPTDTLFQRNPGRCWTLTLWARNSRWGAGKVWLVHPVRHLHTLHACVVQVVARLTGNWKQHTLHACVIQFTWNWKQHTLHACVVQVVARLTGNWKQHTLHACVIQVQSQAHRALKHRTYMSRRFTQISTQEFPNMAECSFSSTLL
jgi:hypothetical protein